MDKSCFVPRSDISGVGEIVELSCDRALVENERGTQTILADQSFGNLNNVDLTKMFKLGDKVAFKADRRVLGNIKKPIYLITFVRKLEECLNGRGIIIEVKQSYGHIKSKQTDKKIFFPATSFACTEPFYHKIKDCTKFFRVNDVVNYVAVSDAPTSRTLYCLSFDMAINVKENAPFVGIVVEVCKEFCRLFIKNYDTVRIFGDDILQGLTDVKKIVEVGCRIELTFDDNENPNNVRLLDDIAKIRLESYKKLQVQLKKTVETSSASAVVEVVDDKDETNFSEEQDTYDGHVRQNYCPMVRGMGEVKNVRDSYAVLHSEKVGDVLVLVNDWLRFNEKLNVDDRFDLRDEISVGEMLYFEAYWFRGQTRDGYRAHRVEKTVDGFGYVKRLLKTYGFLKTEKLGDELFFSGASVLDDFCGFQNLQRTLREHDEVRFAAVRDLTGRNDGRVGAMRYKAVAVAMPDMSSVNGGNSVGVVSDIFPGTHAIIYCRPLGPVYFELRTISADHPSFDLGQRVRFYAQLIKGRYEAVGPYELLDDKFVFKFNDPLIDVANKIEEVQSPLSTNSSGEEAQKHFYTNDDDSLGDELFSDDDGCYDDQIRRDFARSVHQEKPDTELQRPSVEERVQVDDAFSFLEQEVEDMSFEENRRVGSPTIRPPERRTNEKEAQNVFPQFNPMFPNRSLSNFDANVWNPFYSSSNVVTPQFVPDLINSLALDVNRIQRTFDVTFKTIPSNDDSMSAIVNGHSSMSDIFADQSVAQGPRQFISRNLSPISVQSSIKSSPSGMLGLPPGIPIVEKADASCQASLNEEVELFREILADEEIMAFVASKKPSLMFKCFQTITKMRKNS